MGSNDVREGQVDPIPYIAHEADMARQERTISRLWIALILTISLFAGYVIYDKWEESQYMDVVTTVEAETDSGGTAIANADGSVTYYGESESNG